MNAVLRAFPEGAAQSLYPHLALLDLPSDEVLIESGGSLTWVYFPVEALISTSHVMQDGSSVGIALAGNEGMIGSETVLGSSEAIGQSQVMHSGFVYRLSAERLKHEIERDADLRKVLLNYERYLLGQIIQNGACSRLHNVPQRFCRLLLCMLNRLQDNEVNLTQDSIAGILGVRRESVSEVASQLREAGVIRYSRGHMRILDRSHLEHSSCECYFRLEARLSRLQQLPCASHIP